MALGKEVMLDDVEVNKEVDVDAATPIVVSTDGCPAKRTIPVCPWQLQELFVPSRQQ